MRQTKQPAPADPVIPVREIAAEMGITTQAVHNLINRGSLPESETTVTRAGVERRVRGVRRADLDRYLAARRALAELRASA